MNNLTLKELRELHAKYIQQAQDEKVPQTVGQIAYTMGEGYKSNFGAYYAIFPVYFGSQVVVLTACENGGKYVPAISKYEDIVTVTAHVMKDFDTTKFDPHHKIPIFWEGIQVLYWKMSNIRDTPIETDLFVPGSWWEKIKEYAPQADDITKKVMQEEQEKERQELIKKLLIGIEI